MRRPDTNEYANFYSGYIELVQEADIVETFRRQADEVLELFSSVSEEKGGFTYAEGKWTVKELLGHMIDGERIFAYRLHRFSHGDLTELSGFDQDIYIANGRYNDRDIEGLLKEFMLQRHSNLIMITALRDSDWDLSGVASGASVTVRALAFVMAGHVRHHLNILREKYLL